MEQTTISIIIAPHGKSPIAPDCLAAARKSAGEDAEIILVGDFSPREAAAARAKTVHPVTNASSAAARNLGASAAQGDILLFLDSDIILAEDAVPKILAAFRDTPCGALAGTYERPALKTPLFSQYQDLFTIWHHAASAGDGGKIDWFWTSIGAVRKEFFDQVGGFRENSKAEDIEFGFDLSGRGAKIIMRTDALGRHRHRRTVGAYIASVFREAAALTDLHLHKNRHFGLRTPYGGWRNIVTLPNSYFMFITLLIGTFVPSLWWFNGVSAGAALIHSFVINRRLYAYITAGRPFFFRGFLFGAFVFYNHVGTNLIVGAAIACGFFRYLFRRAAGALSKRLHD